MAADNAAAQDLGLTSMVSGKVGDGQALIQTAGGAQSSSVSKRRMGIDGLRIPKYSKVS